MGISLDIGIFMRGMMTNHVVAALMSSTSVAFSKSDETEKLGKRWMRSLIL